MSGFADLPAVGQVIGRSAAVLVTQELIDGFAQVTGDQQWIHTDPARARLDGPYGGTVAHGFLTLSLLPGLLRDCLPAQDARVLVNYGLNRVRFPAPVRAGSSIVATTTLNASVEVDGGLQLTVGFEVVAEGAARPSAVGEIVLRCYR